MVSTVHIVTHEHIRGVWNLTAFVEQLEQVIELTMDVTTNGYWGGDWLNIALLNQDFLDLLAKNPEVALSKHLAFFF